MKKKSFNEISGTMSKAEMKNVMGGPATTCATHCTASYTQNPCIQTGDFNNRCFCISFSSGDPRFFQCS